MENVRQTQSSLLPPLKTRELWAYGIGDVFGGGTFFIIGLLFMFFMTDVVGLPPVLAGLIFIAGKLWDALLDPLIGYVSDHTRSRFGRRRLFFLLGAVPGGLAFSLLWVPMTHELLSIKFLYYLASFLFFTTAYATLMIPYSAFGAEIHPDYKQRNRLTTVRMLCSQLSVLVGGVVPKLIIKAFENQGRGHMVMGMIFGAIYILPWLFVFFGTRESPVAPSVERHSPRSFFQSFGSVFQNRSFRIHICMYLCAYTAVDLVMAMLQYFMKYVLGREDILPVCLGTLLLAQVVMLPVYLQIANRFGKGRAYVTGLAIWLVAMVPVGLLPANTPTVILVALCALLGAGVSAGVMIPWAVLPSLGDVDELITTRKRVGLYAGVMTFVRKLVQAAAIWVLSLALEFSNYVPNSAQSESTITFLRLLYVFGPGILILLGLWAGSRLRLTAHTHGLLVEELERLRAGGLAKDVPQETRLVCEDLTGKPYESLYPVAR